MSTFKISPSATRFRETGAVDKENIDKEAIASKSEDSAKPLLMGTEQFDLSPPKEMQTPAIPTAKEALFTPAPQAQSRSFLSILEELGIDAGGIALNELGKAQLIGRLQRLFGKEYSQNPLALDAVSAFDKEVSKFPMDTKKSLSRMVSNGDRTLKELLKG